VRRVADVGGREEKELECESERVRLERVERMRVGVRGEGSEESSAEYVGKSKECAR